MAGNNDQKEQQETQEPEAARRKKFEEDKLKTSALADSIVSAKPKPDEPKEEKAAKKEPQKNDMDVLSSLKDWKAEEGDDPMVALMKELLQMMLEESFKIRQDIDNHVKEIINKTKEAAKALLGSKKDKVDELRQNINNKLEMNSAKKTLGLDGEEHVSPQLINETATSKLNELNAKMTDINEKITQTGDQYAKDSEALSHKYKNGELDDDNYAAQKDKLDNSYTQKIAALNSEFDEYRQEYDQVNKASQTLTNPTPQQQEQNPSIPELKATADTDDQLGFTSEQLDEAMAGLKTLQEPENDVSQEIEQTHTIENN